MLTRKRTSFWIRRGSHSAGLRTASLAGKSPHGHKPTDVRGISGIRHDGQHHSRGPKPIEGPQARQGTANEPRKADAELGSSARVCPHTPGQPTRAASTDSGTKPSDNRLNITGLELGRLALGFRAAQKVPPMCTGVDPFDPSVAGARVILCQPGAP